MNLITSSGNFFCIPLDFLLSTSKTPLNKVLEILKFLVFIKEIETLEIIAS